MRIHGRAMQAVDVKPRICRDAGLEKLSSFRLPARARELAVLGHPDELSGLLATDAPVMLIGGGSNTLFITDFPGRVVLNRLSGIHTKALDAVRVEVTAAAGEDWHQLVRWSLKAGLYGLENLALIPGLVGAAPMQNIGAYGVELSRVLKAVEVYDRATGERSWLDAAECGLAYRTSRFRMAERDRFVILAVRLLLSRRPRPETTYESLAAELARSRIVNPNPLQVAAAVMRIRRWRLPDPRRLPNAGSFFKNPVADPDQAEALAAEHPSLPRWPLPCGRHKLSAAWMIERLGWMGKAIGDAAVYDRHALVLINRRRATGNDVTKLAVAIQQDVAESFGIVLAPEPLLVGLPADSPLAQ